MEILGADGDLTLDVEDGSSMGEELPGFVSLEPGFVEGFGRGRAMVVAGRKGEGGEI